MDWKIVLLRDAILRALESDDIKVINSILEDALLETSDYQQERMIAAGIASAEDFFYDTYIGPPPVEKSIPIVGDLVSFGKSGTPGGTWCAVDESGDSYEISKGTVGIVLEKKASGFEEYDYDYRIMAGEKIFSDLSDNMFDKKKPFDKKK